MPRRVERSGSERLAVFGYGSLVSRASIAETLGRPARAPIPARLEGWRRRWSVYRHNRRHEKVFERVDGEPFDHVLGLNIEPAAGNPEDEWPNGALIELDEAELGRLELRELRYDRVDVTEGVRVASGLAARGGGFDRVYAFTAKPEHFATEVPPNAIVIESYVRACEAAFRELEPGGWELFEASTGRPPVPVAAARLVQDAIPEGNPRAW